MKVLLVDDHSMLREGLRALLECEDDLRVVGEAGDGHAAVSQALAHRPDVVVMDVGIPGLDGVEAARRVLAALPATKVIGLSGVSDGAQRSAMLDAGAAAYVLKGAASQDLVRAIRGATATSGEAPLRGAGSRHLSVRERETLKLLAEGRTSKEIATEMGVAVSTVETYRRQITDKLGIHTIAELTKYAIRHGITSVR